MENEASAIQSIPLSKAAKAVKISAWALFAAFCLVLFTLFKIPNVRIKNTIQGHLINILAEQGIGLKFKDSDLSIGLLGIHYRMDDAELSFPSSPVPLRLQSVEFTPSVLDLARGRAGGRFNINSQGGTLSGSFSGGAQQFNASFKLKNLDAGKTGLSKILSGIQFAALMDGSGEFSSETGQLNGLNGETELTLKRIIMEPQMIQGFSIPRIQISEGTLNLKAQQGKISLQTVKLGKTGDDLQAVLQGDVTLASQLPQSRLNLKSRFTFSPVILKSFVFLDALLSAGKQSENTYAFALNGTFSFLTPTPISPGGF